MPWYQEVVAMATAVVVVVVAVVVAVVVVVVVVAAVVVAVVAVVTLTDCKDRVMASEPDRFQGTETACLLTFLQLVLY